MVSFAKTLAPPEVGPTHDRQLRDRVNSTLLEREQLSPSAHQSIGKPEAVEGPWERYAGLGLQLRKVNPQQPFVMRPGDYQRLEPDDGHQVVENDVIQLDPSVSLALGFFSRDKRNARRLSKSWKY